MKSVVCWIRRIIRALAAPAHDLAIPTPIWKSLVLDLESRGDGVRESGAFLLGEINGRRRLVRRFVLYDDLEPGCLDRGYINFTSAGYRRLWKVLKQCGLQVVADVHTHPGAPIQSSIDRENPMMPSTGHIALIVPNYAKNDPEPKDVALYIFLGGGQWTELTPGRSARKLYVGRWS